ncbi:phosphatase PAP2 family protein [Streptacidiphilus sp. PB12-B1b]|uniref:phosphatase PAP2 family protein n=1 Tax=Streptacidiphilus sp. PB12-B1b TaxID=2705012 RepID=UPI0015FB09F2|nr:phosphatase PAP2 family protein [Streptacidiphilus sp. PB12-B1b]QMU76040.1 phosphatase PAP2 family protein [Streptacidiphilus sp. PB12-B1b]
MTELALDGSAIDGGLYHWFITRAADAPHWFDSLVSGYASFGLGVFALLMVAGWWRARQAGSAAAMAAALAVPVAVVAAYIVNDLVKSVFDEARPCQVITSPLTIQPCPGVGDWSFPSNHSAIAAASAAALWLVGRRLGAVATLCALAMGFARIWVGAHYPHDVLAGFVLGAGVAVPVLLAARRWGPPLVVRLESGFLRPFLTSSTAG